MKFLLLFPLFMLAQTVFPQSSQSATQPSLPFDSLHTEDQILNYVRTHTEYHNAVFHRSHPALIAYEKERLDSGMHFYEKADFDNNGYTDLLFNGYPDSGEYGYPITLAILRFDKDSVFVRPLPNEFRVLFFSASVVKLDGRAFIRVLQDTYKTKDSVTPHSNEINSNVYTEHLCDTLQWFQTDFIERRHPSNHTVNRIQFQEDPGFGFFSVIRWTIYGDSVKLEESPDLHPKNEFEKGGVFLAKMDTATSGQLYALLEQMDFPDMQEKYEVAASDAATGTLIISYDGNKKKRIADYGMRGTYSMVAIQSLLFGLLDTQSWTKSNAPIPDLIDLLEQL